jgi:hypothetical protein
MPPYIRPPVSFFGWLIVCVWVVAVAYLVWLYPWGIAVIAGLVVASWFGTRKHDEKLAVLIQEREGNSICEFARSFDAKIVDSWVIRAVYEELQAETDVNGRSVPIRADDSLIDDLQIDDEDLDMSIAEKIAQRCGRSLDNFDENPLIGKVKTAGDLVMFFNAQPLESKASGT